MAKTIVIDAGHGGRDPGAVGNGLQEKDITLRIAQLAAGKLERYDGARVLLTRSMDTFLELSERTSFANRAKADALVSVHVNAGGGAGGFESFVYTGASAASAAFQNVLHREIWQRINRLGVERDRGQKRANLHMCRESNMPAVLIECLFIDVAADAAKLRREDVLDAFADGIVAGMAAYLGLQLKQAAAADVPVIVNDKLAGHGRVIDGHVYLPLRQLGDALGKPVHWDNEAKLPYVDGKAVETFSVVDGMTFVGVRAAGELLGAEVYWHGGVKKVFIYQ
ncbi:N-acetylmuramoyl-L-alanine amidase [Cohnella algarum]|uniref:N-acetylmuramoyl-L-alanine amidase n=1 Tax=Cohnella algarum TaxID=2044859 RepID=UPI0019673AE5|nr:N-acetylmuramoyl-L-alanine amidase [Cohnella algarum]MBN2980098.1 N-acetylmuramoyl-L-alanine amidase [Cohnella algarum]